METGAGDTNQEAEAEYLDEQVTHYGVWSLS